MLAAARLWLLALGALALEALGCTDGAEPDGTPSDAGPTADAEARRDAGLDAAPGFDAAPALDAAPDATHGSDSALDAVAPGDGGCPSADVIAVDAGCAPSGLTCQGRKFMCYTLTAVGPVGIERCECRAERWWCSDTCEEWESSLRDH